MTFRAVIFDFDGLIIDSETPIFDIWSEIYRDHGGELTMDQWRHALGTHNGFDPYAELLRQTGVPLSREIWVPRVRDEHWRRCEDEPLRPGVLDRLQEAAELGLSAAVASSSSLEWVGPWLTRHGLRRLVQAVCTRNDVTRVKPAPDLFLLAAERLGVAPARLRGLRRHAQRRDRRPRRRHVGHRRAQPPHAHAALPRTDVTLDRWPSARWRSCNRSGPKHPQHTGPIAFLPLPR